MQVFLVGGAVRDRLMGLTPKDNDYVVVGASESEMLAAGFVRVGADFPVFLHPETKEEYALARTERKNGMGYKGFICDFSPEVTLEEDLSRRDLTINAIALNEQGDIVDPCGGVADLKAGVLRHISPAFAEDPLRVLRVARFAARYAGKGFVVAPETMELMRLLVEKGEIATLTKERVWKELLGALNTDHPDVFVRVLRDCGALKVVLPEVDCLFGIPQPEEHHPEIDTGLHTLMVLQQAVALTKNADLTDEQKAIVRFAALMHDLGKGATDPAEWPRHINHEEAGVPLVKAVCGRLGVGGEFRDMAVIVSRDHLRCHRLLEMRPGKALSIMKALDAFRKPARLRMFALACEADARGRLNLENRDYPQTNALLSFFEAARTVVAAPFLDKGYTGATVGAMMDQARIRAISKVAKGPEKAGLVG